MTLSSNRLVEVEEDALGRLEMLSILYLDQNKLVEIPSSLPSSLIKLYLKNNQITDIQPSNLINLVNLETLDLSGNLILYLPHLPLKKLMILKLKSCGLKEISQKLVLTSPNLKDLYLDDNPINCVDLYSLAEWASPCIERPQDLVTLRESEDKDDVFQYEENDYERKELYLNSISYFDRNSQKPCKSLNQIKSQVQILPKCLSEQKLITSLNITNDARHKANDNKFKNKKIQKHNNKIISSVTKQILNEQGNEENGKNGGEDISKTSLINNDTTTQMNVPSQDGNEDANRVEGAKNAGKLGIINNANASTVPTHQPAHDKSIKSNSSEYYQDIGVGKLFKEKNNKIQSDGKQNNNKKGLKNPNRNYRNSSSSSTKNNLYNKMEIANNNSIENRKLTAANEIQTNSSAAILLNRNLININENNSISDSMTSKVPIMLKKHEQHQALINGIGTDIEKQKSHKTKINKQNYENSSVEYFFNVNVSSSLLNQTISSQEQWNDVRGTTTESYQHPGLLIVVGISIGILLTFVLLNAYRCNCKLRRQNCTVDNFDSNCASEQSDDILTEPLNNECSAVHRDLLPMDILNSTLSHTVDSPNISLQMW